MIIHPMNRKHCEIGIENTIKKKKEKEKLRYRQYYKEKLKNRRPDELTNEES
jgi:hypothetical protein